MRERERDREIERERVLMRNIDQIVSLVVPFITRKVSFDDDFQCHDDRNIFPFSNFPHPSSSPSPYPHSHSLTHLILFD